MASNEDFEKIIGNMSDVQIEAMKGIALRIISLPKSFTGKLAFQLNIHEGGVVDIHVTHGEILKVARKKRKVVSTGIK